ncbi:MAG: acetylxylan esterase [bacterium]|nr:acetylxylan esterase [bacterium]
MRNQLRRQLCLSVGLIIALLAFPGYSQDNVSVSVITDRPDALYHVGETVTFRATVTQGGQAVSEGKLVYALTDDGSTGLGDGELPLTGEPITVTGQLDHPGFLRCTITFTSTEGKAQTGTAAGGFDPLKIKPSLPVPDDFDAFWAEKKKQLAAVPMDPVLTSVESPVEGVTCFDVQVPCLGGMPVSGYYARPSDAQPKSLPAVLWVHGAGVGGSTNRADIAAHGMLVLDINAHGILNSQSSEYYKELRDGKLDGYPFHGREDRETCYFLGMYLRLMRGMDFLAAQPEWDGEILIARGSSQGGGQALVAAGLDSRVTALVANVPAMCDHTGVINGWPRLVPRDAEGTPDPQVQEVSRYFDAMNFATRTAADALVSVGFIDNTCRPTTVYATYNNLPGEKRMLNEPLMKHAYPPEWNDMALNVMLEHIRERQAARR